MFSSSLNFPPTFLSLQVLRMAEVPSNQPGIASASRNMTFYVDGKSNICALTSKFSVCL